MSTASCIRCGNGDRPIITPSGAFKYTAKCHICGSFTVVAFANSPSFEIALPAIEIAWDRANSPKLLLKSLDKQKEELEHRLLVVNNTRTELLSGGCVANAAAKMLKSAVYKRKAPNPSAQRLKELINSIVGHERYHQ